MSAAGTGEAGCPICGRRMPRGGATASVGAGRPAADPFPFCSARCQLVDLGRWLGEEYRVPDRETVVWPAVEDPDRR